jgi:YD repeat-containing protein
MVAALVAWLAVRLTVEYLLRPGFQAPLTLRQSCAHGCSLSVGITSVPPETGHIGDWVLRAIEPGNQIVTTYQPAGRFWTFQFIEAGLIVAITAAALAATIWLLRRRAA